MRIHATRIRSRTSPARTPTRASSQFATNPIPHRAAIRHILRGPRVQAKLTVGPPNDAYEQEADHIADEVVRMPDAIVQRQTNHDKEREYLQMKPIGERIPAMVQRQAEDEEEEEQVLQPKRSDDTPLPLTIQRDLAETRRGGVPLPRHIREFYQPRLEGDLDEVTVHTDEKASALAHDLSARAFTVGRDIFFGAGEWLPTTDRGRWLLAHELVHTQQTPGDLIVRRQVPATTKPAPAGPATGPAASNGTKTPPAPKPTRTLKSKKKDFHVFVYDNGDKVLSPIWKVTAESFAKSVDGAAVQSGASAADTLKNIVQAFDKNRAKYGCIRSIEFFGHGVAGVTLVGPGAIKESDIPAAAAKATALTGSHSNPTLTLHQNFARLRGALCSSSYFHFRSCETFKGAQGAKFASRLAKYLGKTYLIGHTKVIDFNLPGREVYDPTGKKMKRTDKIPEKLIPAKQTASKLPVQNFNIDIDLSGLGKGKSKSLPGLVKFLLASRSSIYLSAKVLDHTDPEKYLLRALLIAPPHVTLGSLVNVIPTLVPSRIAKGPTVGFIKARGDALEVPIDRHLVERIARLRVLTFPCPTPYGVVKIKIAGTAEGPGVLARAGGYELGTGLIFSPAFRKSVLGIASIQLPVTSFGLSVKKVPVDIFRFNAGADVLFGKETALGRLNLGLRVDLETVRADVSVFTGAGLYQGRREWMVGGGLGLGAKFGNFTVDAGWQMFFTGEGGKAPAHAGLLRLGWKFEGP